MSVSVSLPTIMRTSTARDEPTKWAIDPHTGPPFGLGDIVAGELIGHRDRSAS